MNRLEKLIHRIENPIKVSNEDPFDTVKQYWDDVVSGYWQDVDEDLADELGVTPTALSELLEVHRHTFDYANIGGNSSIRGYDHGDDWMVVMFSDGSRYLYTLKSTDRETLDYMRRLATAGKGLNSYITRIVGSNYAGRNHKGIITIKPGMEHFNPEGYRRLLLLQIFRNTMDINTVSNEGIFDALKRMFGGKPADQKSSEPTPRPLYVWEEAALLEKSPPTALGSTTSTSLLFQTNGVYNPNWISRLELDLKQYETMTRTILAGDRPLAAWMQKWEPVLDDFSQDGDRPTEFATAMRGFVKEQPKPWSSVFRNNHDFLGWGKDGWIDGKGQFERTQMAQGSSITIPALGASEVKRVNALLKRLGHMFMTDYEIEEKLTFASFDLTDPPFRAYFHEPEVDDVLSTLIYHSDNPITPADHFNVLCDRIGQLLSVLVNYMKNASQTTSIESHKQNSQNMTLRKYKQQIATAGQDGLDPVARRIMGIGLELFDSVIKPSVESHTEELTVLSNEDLKNQVNQRLTNYM